jgi:hypothetical protein
LLNRGSNRLFQEIGIGFLAATEEIAVACSLFRLFEVVSASCRAKHINSPTVAQGSFTKRVLSVT